MPWLCRRSVRIYRRDAPGGRVRGRCEKWERAYLHCVLLFALDVLLLDLLLLLEDLLLVF